MNIYLLKFDKSTLPLVDVVVLVLESFLFGSFLTFSLLKPLLNFAEKFLFLSTFVPIYKKRIPNSWRKKYYPCYLPHA